MLDVAVMMACEWPSPQATTDWEALCIRAVEQAVAISDYAALAAAPGLAEISLRFTDDAEMQALNGQWRGKDRPTNVLSFPQIDADDLIDSAQGDAGEILLGDIVLGRETCLREAAEKHISLDAHASHLVVHGMLHLLGYDHIDDAEALHMEECERQAMKAMGYEDPYAADGAE